MKERIHEGRCGGRVQRKSLVCLRCKKRPRGSDVLLKRNGSFLKEKKVEVARLGSKKGGFTEIFLDQKK